MNRLLAVVVFGLAASFGAWALPSLVSHLNNESTILWELDGTKDGSSAHNHVANQSFGGFRDRAGRIYAAGSCWDNHNQRFSEPEPDTFDKGHCFVDETTELNQVTYAFVSEMPSDARERVRDAFRIWGTEVRSTNEAIFVGLNFSEVDFNPDIRVEWDKFTGDVVILGKYEPAQQTIVFNSELDWAYADNLNVAGDKYHFMSVALHEVGHAVGLLHPSLGTGDVMSEFLVGQPRDNNGKHHIRLTQAAAGGAAELYGQPVGQPVDTSSACRINLEFLRCTNPFSPNYSVTVFDDTGHGGSVIDLNYRNSGWANWYDLASLDGPGCVAFTAGVGQTFEFVATIITGQTIGECTATIVVSSNQCETGGF